jgi:hypothetical protein
MPRQKSLMTVIAALVREEVSSAVGSLLGTAKPKAKNGRRKRRGKWRPGGPGRPPKAVAEKPPKRRRRSRKRASAAS